MSVEHDNCFIKSVLFINEEITVNQVISTRMEQIKMDREVIQ